MRTQLTVALIAALACGAAAPAAAPPAPADPLPRGALARLGTARLRQSDQVNVVAISPDGRLAAAASRGKDVWLWEIPSGRSRGVLRGRRGEVTALAFAPDGRSLASCDAWQEDGQERGQVRLWDVAKAAPVWARSSPSVSQLCFTPDGESVATVCFREGVSLRKAANGKATVEFTDRTCGVVVAFSPDGKTMASGRGDGSIVLWDVGKLRETGRLTGHKQPPSGLTFSPDGKTLASVSTDETVRVWDVAGGTQTWKFDTGHVWTFAAHFVEDGKALLAVTNGQQLRRWDLATGKDVLVWQDARDAVVCDIAVPRDGRRAVFGTIHGPHRLRILDLKRGREVSVGLGHDGAIAGIDFSPDGKTVATCCARRGDGFRLWDAATGRPVRELVGHTEGVSAVAFSPDGASLLSGSDDGARLWDFVTGRQQKAFAGHAGWVTSVAFSPDGKRFATGDHHFEDGKSRGTARVWDVHTGKSRRALAGHEGAVRQLSFGRDGRTLFTYSDRVRIWDVATGTVRDHLGGGSCELSADGRLMARYVGRQVQVVEVLTGKQLWEGMHGAVTGQVRFSPDGAVVASGGSASVCVWDTFEGEKLREFADAHASPVSALAFSPDGKSLAAGDDWGQVLIWDVRDARPRGPAGRLDLDAMYQDLGGDPIKAYRAVRRLATDPERSVPFLARLLKAAIVEPRPVPQLLADLDDDDFAVRQTATEALAALRKSVLPQLRRLAAEAESLEVRNRARALVARAEADQLTPAQCRAHHAVAALERIGTDAAKVVLKRLLAGHPDALLTQDADVALRRLARR